MKKSELKGEIRGLYEMCNEVRDCNDGLVADIERLEMDLREETRKYEDSDKENVRLRGKVLYLKTELSGRNSLINYLEKPFLYRLFAKKKNRR